MANHFRSLKILHTALLLGMTFFAVVSLVIPREEISKDIDKSYETIFQAVAAGVSLLSLLTGFSIFKKNLAAVYRSTERAEKKMEMYRGACILWWAMIEGPGLLSLIFFVLTGNYAFLALAGFQIALLAVFMPRKDNIKLLLNLTTQDVQKLEGVI